MSGPSTTRVGQRFGAGTLASGLAFTAALAHVLVDYHLGLYGAQATDLGGLQAAALGANALIFGVGGRRCGGPR